MMMTSRNIKTRKGHKRRVQVYDEAIIREDEAIIREDETCLSRKNSWELKKYESCIWIFENAFRYNLAGYKDHNDYTCKSKVNSPTEVWPENNFIRKLLRPDGSWLDFNCERQCPEVAFELYIKFCNVEPIIWENTMYGDMEERRRSEEEGSDYTDSDNDMYEKAPLHGPQERPGQDDTPKQSFLPIRIKREVEVVTPYESPYSQSYIKRMRRQRPKSFKPVFVPPFKDVIIPWSLDQVDYDVNYVPNPRLYPGINKRFSPKKISKRKGNEPIISSKTLSRKSPLEKNKTKLILPVKSKNKFKRKRLNTVTPKNGGKIMFDKMEISPVNTAKKKVGCSDLNNNIDIEKTNNQLHKTSSKGVDQKRNIGEKILHLKPHSATVANKCKLKDEKHDNPCSKRTVKESKRKIRLKMSNKTPKLEVASSIRKNTTSINIKTNNPQTAQSKRSKISCVVLDTKRQIKNKTNENSCTKFGLEDSKGKCQQNMSSDTANNTIAWKKRKENTNNGHDKMKTNMNNALQLRISSKPLVTKPENKEKLKEIRFRKRNFKDSEKYQFSTFNKNPDMTQFLKVEKDTRIGCEKMKADVKNSPQSSLRYVRIPSASSVWKREMKPKKIDISFMDNNMKNTGKCHPRASNKNPETTLCLKEEKSTRMGCKNMKSDVENLSQSISRHSRMPSTPPVWARQSKVSSTPDLKCGIKDKIKENTITDGNPEDVVKTLSNTFTRTPEMTLGLKMEEETESEPKNMKADVNESNLLIKTPEMTLGLKEERHNKSECKNMKTEKNIRSKPYIIAQCEPLFLTQKLKDSTSKKYCLKGNLQNSEGNEGRNCLEMSLYDSKRICQSNKHSEATARRLISKFRENTTCGKEVLKANRSMPIPLTECLIVQPVQLQQRKIKVKPLLKNLKRNM